MEYFTRLEWMYSMAVWDNSGRQYLPIMGYDGIIMCYMNAHDALAVVAAEFDIVLEVA